MGQGGGRGRAFRQVTLAEYAHQTQRINNNSSVIGVNSSGWKLDLPSSWPGAYFASHLHIQIRAEGDDDEEEGEEEEEAVNSVVGCF